MAARNDAEIKGDVQNLKDDFKASFEGLKNGELDKTVIKALHGLADVGELLIDGAQKGAAATVGSIVIIPTVLLNGIDKGGEYIREKLEGSQNNYSKTLGTIPRALFGENSKTSLNDRLMLSVMQGYLEGYAQMRTKGESFPKVTQEELKWAKELQTKVQQMAYQATPQEIGRYTDIYYRHQFEQEGESKKKSSVKGLLDYPKDVFVGVTATAIKSFERSFKAMNESADAVIAETGSALEGLKEGELDKMALSVFDASGNLATFIGHGVKAGVSTWVGGVALIPAAVLHYTDKAGEWVGQKLDNSNNNYGKTLGTVPRVLVGKESNGDTEALKELRVF